MTTLFGIKNCDTVKKARKWLDEHQVPYQFHDFRSDGLTEQQLSEFVEKSSWGSLLNKRSTTFRNLPEEIKNNVTDDIAFEQSLEQPTLLKRPILITDSNILVGFKKEQYQEIFSI